VYIRPSHLPSSREDVTRLIREHRFGALVGHSPSGGIVATHLPFIFDADRGPHGTLVAHLAKANSHSELLKAGQECMVIFNAAQGYISPSWYPQRATPPAWIYAVAHCYGRPSVMPPNETLAIILRLVAAMEEGHADPWSIEELPEAQVAALVANVVAFEIPLDRIEAKFKMAQGEKPNNLVAAARQIEASGNHELATLVRRYNPAAFQHDTDA
jgi:transcriptional regulator